MIFTFENAIPEDLIAEVRASLSAYMDKHSFNPNGTWYNRIGKTVPISEIPELRDVDTKINIFFSQFAQEVVGQRFRPMFPAGDSGFDFHRYEPGDTCLVHSDSEVSFRGDSNAALLRFATVIFYLNTPKEGGELVFPDQKMIIKPKKGLAVIFPPTGVYPHYTNPAAETRDILMTWMVYSNLNVVRV